MSGKKRSSVYSNMPNVCLVFGDFLEMVGALPAAKLDLLYENHWTCLAVLRSLPPLGKQYVLRLLYVDVPVPAKTFEVWLLPDTAVKHKLAIDQLEQLRVLIGFADRTRGKSYVLNPKIQRQIRQAFISGSCPPTEPRSRKIAVGVPSCLELDLYSTNQWESVLLQLVSIAVPDKKSTCQDPFITQIFQHAALLTATNWKEPARITVKGVQFLLMDMNYQLWQIVREYVVAAEDSGEMISFLLELGFHTSGEPYNMKGLTTIQRNIVTRLAVLGLVMVQEGMGEKWFVPTKLAANLSASLSESGAVQESEGFVIVETNFRIYAHTCSKLQMEILRLFSRIDYQLRNIVVGSLTRDSLNPAFASGINSEQIIYFLQKHAHSQVAKRVPVVPESGRSDPLVGG